MTDKEKEARLDATRYLVLEFGDGNSIEVGFTVKGSHDNEPDARKQADELALAQPGTRYAVFQKLGTTMAALKTEWKSAGPVISERAS